MRIHRSLGVETLVALMAAHRESMPTPNEGRHAAEPARQAREPARALELAGQDLNDMRPDRPPTTRRP